jgi:hypothetical protein
MTIKNCRPALWLLLWGLILSSFLFPSSSQAAGKNKLTVINQSGEDTAIKLIGPREWLIDIPAGQERSVLLPSGDYTYVTRYGQDPNFRYSRGTPFQIEASRTGFTEATLTLISAPSSTYLDPVLVEQFNRPVTPPPEPPVAKTPPEEKAPPMPASPKDKPQGDFILHRVSGGETLPTISEYYSGEADYWPEIAKYNTNLDPLRLKAGSTVKIPVYLAIIHKTPPEAKPSTPSPKTPRKQISKPLSPPPDLPKPPQGGFGPK